MPLPVRYIDSHEYQEDGTASKSHHSNGSSQVTVSFPILDKATPSGKLQALSVHNLTNVIRELGSLAKHAESVMGDLADILVSYHQRTVHLEERTKHLSEEILPSLDADREACEGFVIPHPDFHFKSDRHIDQQLLSKDHIPQALLAQIKNLAYSPALCQFSSLWDDGRNAMHLYSNPDFFFEHWRTSMRKEALRRKSTVDNLLHVPTSGQTGSRRNGELKKKVSHKESATHQGDKAKSSHVRRVGGSKSLKRNSKLSKSFHGGYDRSRYYHGSSLSLEGAGTRTQSRSFSRTYSFRAVSRSSSSRYSFSKKERSRLHAHFSKATAANFDGPMIELSVPDITISEPINEDEEVSSEKVKGTHLRRTQSSRGSTVRSRSPNPKTDVNDSVFTGMHMYTVEEELSQQEKSKISTLSKQHLLSLDLATSDFQACLSIDSSRKLNSSFTPPSSIFDRSITPIFSLVNATPITSEQTHSPHPRREPPPIPDSATKPTRTSPDTRDHRNKLPKFRRSATISAGNPVIKKTAENLKKMYMSGNGRPASVALVEDQLVELFNPNDESSHSSLDSNVNSQNRSITRLPAQPHNQTSLESLERTPTSSVQSQVLETKTIQTEVISEDKVKSEPLQVLKSSDSTISTSKVAHSLVPGPPPPPRNDSLNGKTSLSDPPTAGAAVASTTQRHSSLDTSQKESIASALSNVLKRKQLPNSPDKPLSPSSPLRSTAFSKDGFSPVGLPPNRIHQVMSPNDIELTERSSDTVYVSTTSESNRKRRPPPLIKQGSLYISPRKLSVAGFPSPDDVRSRHQRKAGQILKAGGVDSGDLSGSRSNLLEAIRKGIQLRKVEEVEEDKKDEEAAPWDVAAILERYQVLHSEEDTSSDEEIQDWDDFDDI